MFTQDPITKKEILSSEVTHKQGEAFISALIGGIVLYGVNRIESAIRQTYCPKEAGHIISLLNLFASSLK